MAKRFKKNEKFKLGSENLLLTVYSGDANHSDITVELNTIEVVNRENIIQDFDLGNVDGLMGSELFLYVRISKTNPSNHVSLTVKLNDGTNSKEYPYHSIEAEDKIIKYEITIKLSKND